MHGEKLKLNDSKVKRSMLWC